MWILWLETLWILWIRPLDVISGKKFDKAVDNAFALSVRYMCIRFVFANFCRLSFFCRIWCYIFLSESLMHVFICTVLLVLIFCELSVFITSAGRSILGGGVSVLVAQIDGVCPLKRWNRLVLSIIYR